MDYTQVTGKRAVTARDGLELAYWVADNAGCAARTLVLLHGGASNHTRWSEFVEYTRLTSNWRIACPDMRGNGESMTRGHMDIDTWCDDLRDILDAEKAGCAVLAGHSLGAQIAAHFAHRYPDRVSGLVLIDPIFEGTLKGRQALVRRHRWFFVTLTRIVQALNALGLHRRHIQDRDLRELDEETRAAIRGNESFEAIAKRYGALRPILANMPTANYLRQALATVSPLPPADSIRVPVLVLLSGGTTLADIDANRDRAARFPDHEIVTLDANHWPLTETPDAVREAIDEWVERRFGNARDRQAGL